MPAFEGVWMLNRDINDVPHYVPLAVIHSFEVRGWEVTDLPTELDSDDPEFVEALETLLADQPTEDEAETAEEEGSK